MNGVVLVYQEDKGAEQQICDFLNEKGYCAVCVGKVSEMDKVAGKTLPSVIITDIPGIADATRIKEQFFVPFMVLSADAAEPVKVKALDGGAEDYIVRPFMKEEFLARLRVVIRRRDKEKKYSVNGLEINFKKRIIKRDGKEIKLTPIEYKIVELLCCQPGSVLTHEYILKHIWGPYVHGDNKILRVNITNIRKKLERDPSNPVYILTESGIGYRMSDNGFGE